MKTLSIYDVAFPEHKTSIQDWIRGCYKKDSNDGDLGYCIAINQFVVPKGTTKIMQICNKNVYIGTKNNHDFVIAGDRTAIQNYDMIYLSDEHDNMIPIKLDSTMTSLFGNQELLYNPEVWEINNGKFDVTVIVPYVFKLSLISGLDTNGNRYRVDSHTGTIFEAENINGFRKTNHNPELIWTANKKHLHIDMDGFDECVTVRAYDFNHWFELGKEDHIETDKISEKSINENTKQIQAE